MQSEIGLVKIGIAKHPTRRQTALRRASGLKIDIARTFETDKAFAVERATHTLLRSKRKAGEWFDASVKDATAAIKKAAVIEEAVLLIGSGEKSSVAGPTAFMMTASEVKAVDDWSFAHRVRGRSEAIRQLIVLGLKASGKKKS